MAETQNATDWFDSLLAYPWDEPDLNKTWWCHRHWAPSPLLAAQGAIAHVNLQSWALARLLPERGWAGKRKMRELERWAYTKPICCWAGDEVIFKIWSLAPPKPKEEATQAETA